MFRQSSSYKNALDRKTPIVAFESAIISHGLPYPSNIELINDLYEIAGSYDVYPAIFWLHNGEIRIGFDDDELEKFALSEERVKISGRDIPYALVKRKTGGTTVAATTFLAHQVGINIFATGGMGGVHHGAERSFDISNDLFMLSQTPLIVISAGFKAILDIRKTLELTETLGIPLYGYKTGQLPLFYSASSPYPVDRIESVNDLVDLYRLHKASNLDSALLIANPVPAEWSLDPEILHDLIDDALREAEKRSISGQQVTPFLLDRLNHSGHDITRINVELVKNNFHLAAEVARKMS